MTAALLPETFRAGQNP